MDKGIIFLRKHLTGILKDIEELLKATFNVSDTSIDFPFAVLDLKEGEAELYRPFSLEVETWDNKEDTSQLENICEKIRETLDKHKYLGEGFFLQIFFNNKGTVIDEDKEIKRRLQIFEVKLYEYEN